MQCRKILALLGCLVIIGSIGAASTSTLEQYIYVERVGETCKTVKWSLARAEHSELTYRTEDQVHITTVDAALSTLRWHCEYPEQQTEISAQREGNFIRFSGRRNGKPIDERRQIGPEPWYQATSISLRRWVVSDQSRVVFWTVRPDTLEVHQLEAEKKAEERVFLNGVEEATVRIQLRLTGWRAPFWKSDYWYRKSDGVFLRFSGPSGPPGEPLMIVEYRGHVGQSTGCGAQSP